jgi:hypothetical protein
MSNSKTSTPLKGVFDSAKAQAAEALMQPEGARNRKAGGRGVRISGYIPSEVEEKLRDEVVRRTVAERRSVSLNDVLVSILTEWSARP